VDSLSDKVLARGRWVGERWVVFLQMTSATRHAGIEGWRSVWNWGGVLGWFVAATVLLSLIAPDSLPAEEAPAAAGLRPGHWASLLPPLLAILVALHFRSLVAALLSAFLLGAFLSFGFNPFVALPMAVNQFLLENLLGQFSLYLFGFLFALVGMIHVCHRSGGLEGMVGLLSRFARGPKSAQAVTVGAGFLIFFDDYANTVVVGQSMQSLTDRYRVAREKLAYLVDSTTAPVAGLALVSTWIAFEVFLLGGTAAVLGIKVSGYGIFLALLPLRFYCLGTLLFVGVNIGSGREFGPMRAAALRARSEGLLNAPDARLLLFESKALEPPKGMRCRARNALIPLGVVIGSVVLGILFVGRHRLLNAGESFDWQSFESWQDAFGRTVYDSSLPDGGPGVALVLFWSAVAGGAVAMAMASLQRILTLREAGGAYLRSIPALWMAVFILLMAWSMKSICEQLGTSLFLVSLLGDQFPPVALPVVTFLLAAGMAFTMGTSWGTMAVMIPVMLPLAHTLTGGGNELSLIFLLTAAAVLDGAIFGDHCSPISDTTVLSSMASGCDHIHHVRTQLPYALVTMVLCSITGYIPVALEWYHSGWFWMLFPIGALAILIGVGRPIKAA